MDIKNVWLILYSVVLILLALYSLHICILVILSWWHRKDSVQKTPLPDDLPMVTIQLPVYNERYVIKRLIDSVCSLDYPADKMHIQVLDDSDDITKDISRQIVAEYKEKGFDIEHIHRDVRFEFKAGALKQALATAKGEFIAIFDSDFTPPKDFLKSLLVYFSSEKIGMVQARWTHINPNHSILTKVQAMMLDIHFLVEQPARFYAGCFINFNGTAGIWKKQCIIDAGNWSGETVSEDMDLSYRAQMKGWKFIYAHDVLVPAELPIYVSAFKSQQYRWAQGTFQCAKKHTWALLSSKMEFFKKIQAIIHLTNYLSYPLLFLWGVVLLPVSIGFNRIHPNISLIHIITIYVVAIGNPLLACLYARSCSTPGGRHRVSWTLHNIKLLPAFLFVNCGMCINNTFAILKTIFTNQKPVFIRTPKFGIEKKTRFILSDYSVPYNKIIFIEIILGCFCLWKAIYFAINGAIYTSPFFLIYSVGFFYMAGMEILHRPHRKQEVV